MNQNIKIKAYGKLNLFLDITGVRDDGYHLLKTVMQSVSIYDVLSFEISDGDDIKLVCDCDGFPCDERNLIWKAIDAFYKYTKIYKRKKITVTIEKNIPSMAGMAGGSSDCAATLVAMNILFDTNLTINQLCEIGVTLGADVPFTLTGGTVLCEGIGEKLTILNSLPEIYFAVVKPNVSISTPQAYKIYDSLETLEKKSYEAFEKSISDKNINEISSSIYNALEIAADFEEIHSAKSKMLSLGAKSSMMTGSGSAVFGIFDNKKAAENCIQNMKDYSFSQVLTTSNCGWKII